MRISDWSSDVCSSDLPSACRVHGVKARLVAVGERAPRWVAEGYAEYEKRLSHWLPLELVEITPGLRRKHRDAARATQDEGARVLAALPKTAHVVVLDARGTPHSSEQLAVSMAPSRGPGPRLAFRST